MAKYAYIIRVKLQDGTVKTFGVPIQPVNTWMLAAEKKSLAAEFGVSLDDVIVHHREHGAIL